MTIKTWNGSTGSFDDATKWTPTGVPTIGDTALITAGAVLATFSLPSALRVEVKPTAAGAVRLELNGATIAMGTRIVADTVNSPVSLVTDGTVRSGGAITFATSGSSQGIASIGIQDGTGGAAGQFVNDGGISVVNEAIFITNSGSNAATGLVNNGTLSVRSGSSAFVTAAITGTGVIRLAADSRLQAGRAVSSGQTIAFESGSGPSQFQIVDGAEYHGTITGFGASDQVSITSTRWTTSSYAYANGVGTFTFSQGGTAVATVAFQGSYSAGDFSISSAYNAGLGTQQTAITTTVAEQPTRLVFTDTSNDVSGSEAATLYTGPVAGLQYEYIWSSPDDVAMAAQAPNMFLHGGAGNDAITALSGTNVLDGGGGSNFLTGVSLANGGGSDTFFVDGRGGTETWSTLVNFLPGDSATIFGFKAGVSTLPWTASDGAPGYTGATIHSELGGAGTGVNGSVTFAGISLATATDPSKFTVLTGSVGGSDYLYIHYNS